MAHYELFEVSHGRTYWDASEKFYYPGGAPPGYRLSYRVLDYGSPRVRGFPPAVADCPTLEAARAALRLLGGEP